MLIYKRWRVPTDGASSILASTDLLVLELLKQGNRVVSCHFLPHTREGVLFWFLFLV